MNSTSRLYLTAVLTVVCAFSITSMTAADEGPSLAVVHKVGNLTCTTCHAVASPTKPPNAGVCIDCHGSALDLARRTEGISPNPHASPHLAPDVRQACTECHHVHQPQEVTCAECHKSFKGFQFSLHRRSRGGTPQ